MNNKAKSYAVLVARCQVPTLHEGHNTLFTKVSSLHPHTILFLGVSSIGSTFHNPLDFETRKAMILEKYPSFIVLPMIDMSDDTEWSKALDAKIQDVVQDHPVTLYGSRDSFIPYYEGNYPTQEILDLPTVGNAQLSGTHIRSEVAKGVSTSEDFRAGVIYAMSNLHPSVKATVDIVIIHYSHATPPQEGWGDRGLHLQLNFLLDRKPNEDRWRFIGGFSEPTSISFEFDAIREVKEETGLNVSQVNYLGSTRIYDWRWKKEPDQIKTLVFVANSPSMDAVASDDIEEVRWFLPSELGEDLLIHAHKDIFRLVKRRFHL